MVERFNGRIEDVLQSHRFKNGEDLEQTILRYVALYNSQLPQSALASRTPLQAMKDWHKLRPELFKKQPYYLTGCDNYGSPTVGLFLCYQHIFAIFKHQAVVIIRSKNDTNVQTLGSPNIYWSKVDVDTSTHPAVTLPQ